MLCYWYITIVAQLIDIYIIPLPYYHWIINIKHYSRKDSIAIGSLDSRSGSIGSKDQLLRRKDSRLDINPIPEDNNVDLQNNNTVPRRPSLYRSVRLVHMDCFVIKGKHYCFPFSRPRIVQFSDVFVGNDCDRTCHVGSANIFLSFEFNCKTWVIFRLVVCSHVSSVSYIINIPVVQYLILIKIA